MRALGLGLAAIVDVLAGAVSIAEAVAAERASLDSELARLTWRRAALLAVEQAPPTERSGRLELLATVTDRRHAQDEIQTFWRRMLTPMRPEIFDGFVSMNLPDLPPEPDPRQIVAYAELVTLITDDGFRTAMSEQIWRTEPALIRDRAALLTHVAAACESAGHRLLEGTPPNPGSELDRFVDAHATARGQRDTPEFRRRLLLSGTDCRIQRYWKATGAIITTSTSGAALDWLDEALRRSAEPH